MKTIKTSIHLNASPQTVWSVMDNLTRYPEWNRLTADLSGRTTVDSVVRGTLTKPNTPPIPIGPTLISIVAAREFRWLTDAPGFRAEHYFLLQPTPEGGTDLVHGEDFAGEALVTRWPGIEASSPAAFNQLNRDLKARAEQYAAVAIPLHPSLDRDDSTQPSSRSAHVSLRCLCADESVAVNVRQPVYHNHLCGCSKCWKPEGALFAQTAIVASRGIEPVENAEKLRVVDPTQSIRRHACTVCGAHLYGDVEDPNHHFFGLCFIHPELALEPLCGQPEFAGFVSSLVEAGTDPSLTWAIRRQLARRGLAAFDEFSPEIMDAIAWHRRKVATFPKLTS